MNINVTHIAKLANLPLTPDEKEKFEKQLSEVLSYVEQLQKIDTSNIIPTSQVTGLENVLREDSAGESLSQEDALSQTKSSQNGLFKVSGIFEE
jgi:aspartyl-tRNA(Asn)/glutamyl-tRNA(Gln) amidotransferase subunit C